MKRKIMVMIGLLIFVATGCTRYDPVPASQCHSIVTHAQGLLKENAPAYEKMMNDCKAATDEKRGCAKAAKNGLKLLGCLN